MDSRDNAQNRETLESTFSHNALFLSLRDTAAAVAWQSNSAPAESNQINGARKACNLESVVGGLGAKGVKKDGGIRESSLPIQAPLSPLEKTLSQAKLESSNNAQRVDSSVDCHAAKAARNDRKHTQNLESTFEKTQMDCHALPSGKDRNDRWGSALACNDEKNAISKKVDSSTATTPSLRGGGLPRR